MQDEHRAPFAQCMTVLAEALDADLQRSRLEIYWRVLSPYDWSAVEAVLEGALRRKWFKFPQPGELVEWLEGTPDERREAAEHAWRQLWQALGHGTYRSLFCEDRVLAETIRQVLGGWTEAGMLPRGDSEQAPMYRARQKEFVAAYV